MTGTPANGWPRAEMHVLDSLDRLEKGLLALQESVGCIDRKLASLTTEVKIKSGLWGAVAGLFTSVLAAIAGWFAGVR